MSKPLFCTLILLMHFAFEVKAQSNPRYLILYKDKANSPYSVETPGGYLSERAISRRARQNIAIKTSDLPVNPSYVDAIKQTGASVIYSSRWFNGSLVEASASQLAEIKKLPFYKGIELNKPVANLAAKSPGIERVAAIAEKSEATEDLNYGNMNAQLALMEVPELHKKGFQGENMIIAVLDNGFSKLNEVAYMKAVMDEKRVIDTYDFIARESNVYNDGSHGLNVISTIAAYQPGTMIGSAFKGTFALYRTETNAIEGPYEEITWLIAAERADSLGADIINSSLGYSTFEGEFDTPEYNYTYEDMDGKTTIISRAARMATRTGVLVVNSAGNEGDNAWGYIVAPADVDSVLTVGASTYDRSHASLSSMGPNAAGQQKPDIAAVGAGAVVGNVTGNAVSGSGTSFSAPQVAGLCAILWQAYPNLSAQQIIYILKKSGSQYSNPDNFLGYGVPSVLKAEQIISDEFEPMGTENSILKSVIVAPNPVHSDITISYPATLVGKNANVGLYSPNGASLWTSSLRLAATQTIDTSQLTTGLYLIKIKVGDQEKTFKLIKQ